MYKVLIADDEMLARVGIKSLISWQDYGFEVVAEAENGRKALEMANRFQPDLIITDIKMPIMDGIELFRELRKQGHPAKVVILSAYDDFPYVKEALKMGAEDYLIKLDMQPEHLTVILQRVSQALKTADLQNGVRHRQLQNLGVLQQKFLSDLLLGWIHRFDEVQEKRDELQITLPNRDLICFVLHPDDDKYASSGAQDIHLLDFAIMNIIEEILRDKKWGYVCTNHPHQYAVLFVPEQACGRDHLQQSCIGIVMDIQHALKKYLNVSITAGISDVQPSLMEAERAYNQACEALTHRFRYPRGSKITYGAIIAVKSNASEEPAIYSDALRVIDLALSGKEMEVIEVGFEKLKKLLTEDPNPQIELFIRVCTALLFSLLAQFKERGREIATETGRALYEELGRFKVRNDVLAWLERCKHLALSLDDLNDTIRSITQAKQWVARNYMGDTSLETVAGNFNFSAKYFSALFKKCTGINFVDYVTDTRIDKAKKLLRETNMRIFEVALNVGYENEQYFSRVFKKSVGQSPLQYRQKS
ncbi:MAG: response regulator [Gorillibacterium sp.]|nr:response regulator [Gorillibacterium sp.]